MVKNMSDSSKPEFDIFLSHRIEDRTIALYMRGAISFLSDFKLRVHVCEEIPGGKDWRRWINDKISISKILIFLYTQEIADWQWCLYEIGLFQGRRLSNREVNNNHMICIKNPDIKPPSPIENFQAYNADEKGFKNFFEDLLVRGIFTDEIPYIDYISETEKYRRLQGAARDLTSLFSLPKIENEYYIRRLVFELDKQIADSTTVEIDDAVISGDQVTMEEILDLPSSTVGWRQLYEQFQGRSSWLDEIRNALESLKVGRRVQASLTPFANFRGEWFTPIITRIQKKRSTVEGKTLVVPKSLITTFIPRSLFELQPQPQNILKGWNTYLPWSVVRIRWRKKSGHVYSSDDMIGSPVVCTINEAFSDLYDFTYDSHVDTAGDSAWTTQRLLDSVNNYILPEDRLDLEKDQVRVSKRIIFEERDDYAKVPLRFNEQHPKYANTAQLPCLLAKCVIGPKSGEHETYLLIVYVPV